MFAFFPALLASFGCAPPDAVDPEFLADPTIEVLFPVPGQTLTLNEACQIDTVIVVDAKGIDVRDFTTNPPDREREGHWHGGPSLESGFCRSFDTFCGPRTPEDVEGYVSEAFSDGQTAFIFATLVTNTHRAVGQPDQVEVTLEAPVGVDCP